MSGAGYAGGVLLGFMSPSTDRFVTWDDAGRGAMSDVFGPSVRIAVAVVVVSVPAMWLVAVFVAKVLRWPSRRTVGRWARSAQRNPAADPPMTPMLVAVLVLGLALPLNVGIVLLRHVDAPMTLPQYTGHVVETGACGRGVAELWWLYRCEALVEITEREVAERSAGTGPGLPEPPREPVWVELLAREPAHAGDAVGLETRFDDDGEIVRQWGLISESGRPAPVAGVLVGSAVVLALSIPVGLWWRRSRPGERPAGGPGELAASGDTPVWTEAQGGYRIEVRAKRLSMAGLTWLVVLGVAIGAALGAVPLVALQAETGIEVGRREVVLVGLLVGAPFAAAFLVALRRGVATYGVEITSWGVRVASDRESFEWAWAQIDRLTVRTDSDYARLRVSSRPHGSLTFMIGVLNRGRGTSRMPHRLRALVVGQGFTERVPPAGAPGLHRFTSTNR
ncbi:hypothetical protein [Myceligenerans salitolerans]|uniref:Uncharacterized protein n=1 Tax=Myceligenerans salitolerans TaxID=1230528 RepID=A0ABS3IBF1_9MICO|nr:hypothetical protein [Myceligenerans salitolerans]MBO0610346.1 hypothetical protein [Myceligenerans salitolerans]